MDEDKAIIIAEIARIVAAHPSLRFGQILGNALDGDLYYVSDRRLAEALTEYREKYCTKGVER